MKLWVKVIPRSEKFGIYRKGADVILRATESPEKGKVNTEIVKELGRLLKVRVRIVRGLTDRKKLLDLEGEEDAILAKIQADE